MAQIVDMTVALRGREGARTSRVLRTGDLAAQTEQEMRCTNPSANHESIFFYWRFALFPDYPAALKARQNWTKLV